MEKLLGLDQENVNVKLKQFDQIISHEVEQRCAAIQQELEEYRRQELENEENSILQDSYTLIQQEMAEIEAETTKAISKSRVEMKQKLYARREAYSQALFAEARDRLKAFTQIPAYHTFLLDKVKAIAESYGCDGFLLLVRESDLQWEQELRQAFGYACTVQASPEVALGGLIARHPEKGYVVDESLAFILEHQKQWLISQTDLIVSM